MATLPMVLVTLVSHRHHLDALDLMAHSLAQQTFSFVLAHLRHVVSIQGTLVEIDSLRRRPRQADVRESQERPVLRRSHQPHGALLQGMEVVLLAVEKKRLLLLVFFYIKLIHIPSRQQQHVALRTGMASPTLVPVQLVLDFGLYHLMRENHQLMLLHYHQ